MNDSDNRNNNNNNNNGNGKVNFIGEIPPIQKESLLVGKKSEMEIPLPGAKPTPEDIKFAEQMQNENESQFRLIQAQIMKARGMTLKRKKRATSTTSSTTSNSSKENSGENGRSVAKANSQNNHLLMTPSPKQEVAPPLPPPPPLQTPSEPQRRPDPEPRPKSPSTLFSALTINSEPMPSSTSTPTSSSVNLIPVADKFDIKPEVEVKEEQESSVKAETPMPTKSQGHDSQSPRRRSQECESEGRRCLPRKVKEGCQYNENLIDIQMKAQMDDAAKKAGRGKFHRGRSPRTVVAVSLQVTPKRSNIPKTAERPSSALRARRNSVKVEEVKPEPEIKSEVESEEDDDSDSDEDDNDDGHNNPDLDHAHAKASSSSSPSHSQSTGVAKIPKSFRGMYTPEQKERLYGDGCYVMDLADIDRRRDNMFIWQIEDECRCLRQHYPAKYGDKQFYVSSPVRWFFCEEDFKNAEFYERFQPIVVLVAHEIPHFNQLHKKWWMCDRVVQFVYIDKSFFHRLTKCIGFIHLTEGLRQWFMDSLPITVLLALNPDLLSRLFVGMLTKATHDRLRKPMLAWSTIQEVIEKQLFNVAPNSGLNPEAWGHLFNFPKFQASATGVNKAELCSACIGPARKPNYCIKFPVKWPKQVPYNHRTMENLPEQYSPHIPKQPMYWCRQCTEKGRRIHRLMHFQHFLLQLKRQNVALDIKTFVDAKEAVTDAIIMWIHNLDQHWKNCMFLDFQVILAESENGT